ncbi:MAG: hypothetical protein IKY71_00145, partial [Bacteroidaceae bacterium]|nr:hypothetical protein [Bacteroidaceae bacterium]
MKTKLLFATLLLLAISWQQTNAQTVLPEMTKAITGDRIENVYNGTDSISSSIKFKKRNSFLILMNMEYEVLIARGDCTPQLADTTNIKKQVKEFLLNADRKEEDAEYIKMELPILGEREVISRDHCIMIMVHESMIDSASNSIDYLSKDHPHIIEQLYGAYNEIRDEFAIKEFNKPFDQCNEEQKNVCRIAYPCMILSHERSHERYATVPPPPGAEYKLITTDSISGYVINEEREDSITYRICHETATLELGGNGCIDAYTIGKLNENINVGYVKNLIIGPDVSEYNYSFFLSSLVSITVDKENKVYDSRENCNAIIETKTNTMIMGCESTFIPNGVEIIKDNCLRDLRNIHIPASVKLIEDSGNLYADSITVDKENKVYDSRENCNAIIETETNTMIMGCWNTFIPNGVEIIKEDCLQNLENIHIPASVKLIEDSGNSLLANSITVDKENKVYDSRENCNAIIETETNTMIMGCESTFIPNGVEIIKDNC